MEYTQIIYQPGKVARIILNRTRYLNAQSRIMLEEMDDAFKRAAADDAVGAILLSAEGKHFSSGHDLGTPEEKADRGTLDYPGDKFGRYRWARHLYLEHTMRWRNLPKATIAMVHGYCIWGGWIISAAMDIIFASEDALFLPSHFQCYTVPWDIGPRKAKEVLYERRFMSAWEAYDHGFVNRVYPREKLEEETLAYAERVAEHGLENPFRIYTTKFSTNHMMDGMGFTTAVDAAFQSNALISRVITGDPTGTVPRPEDGGAAGIPTAMKNYELTKSWLESVERRNRG